MKRIRALSAAAALLAAASGFALLPAVGGRSGARPTTTDGSGHLNCVLGLGNAGEAVARLQIGLDDCNFHAGLTVDSIYGTKTQGAVEQIERASSLPVDGVFGQLTSGRMQWPVKGSNPIKCDWWG